MARITCPDCGVGMLDCRRYPLEPLAEFMHTSVAGACRAISISGSTERAVRCHGITRTMVDKAGVVLHEHPSAIWPEIVDHDIEDSTRPCKECGERFVPDRVTQWFCCRRHQKTYNGRILRSNWTPEQRARVLAAQKERYTKKRDRLLAEKRTERGRRAGRQKQKTRYWGNPMSRERKLAANQRWKARNRKRLQEYQREYRARRREKSAA